MQYYQALQPSNFPFAGKTTLGEKTLKGSLESITPKQTGALRQVDSKINRKSMNLRDSRTSVKGIQGGGQELMDSKETKIEHES